jgi:hypothetical protein
MLQAAFTAASILSARPATTPLGASPTSLVSAEDIVLAKLLWYRAGGEVSERQWNDLVSLVEVQRNKTDSAYLETQAAQLGMADLLTRLWKG